MTDHTRDDRLPGSSWPFVGRRRELGIALDELADPTSAGILVVGPAGVGKTRLLDELAVRLAAQGRWTNRVVGAEATRTIPFAAIAHSLPPDVLSGDRPPDALRVFSAVRSLANRVLSPGDRFVTIVDDIVDLDEPSMVLLTQLITAGVAAVAATVRTGVLLPPVLASLERGHRLARLDIEHLDEAAVTELLEAALGGPVERQTARQLAQTSGGNTLYLRELVQAARERGILVAERGHCRLVAPLSATSRLTEAVTRRLDGLPEEARELLEILAVAEPLSIDDLDAAGLGDAALVLDGAGLVTASDLGGSTVVRLAHPLYGEVVRTSITVLRRRHLLLRAADAVGATGRVDDAVRLAAWRTAAGAPVEAVVLRRALDRARAANDFVLTEQLARVAVAQAPDLDVRMLLAEALHELGRFAEANGVLADAVVTNDVDRLRVAALHHRVHLWGSLDPAASIEVLEAAAAEMAPGTLRSMLFIAMANTYAFDARPSDALAALDRCDVDDVYVAVGSSFPRSIAVAALGDPVAGAEIARSGRERLESEPSASLAVSPALLLLAEASARCEAGEFAEAESLATIAYDQAVEQRIPQLHVWLALMLGRIHIYRGHPAESRRWMAEALRVADDVGFAPGRRIALTGLAVCAGQLADVPVCASLLAELDQLPDDIGFLRAEVGFGRAWVLAALGQVDDAVDVARTAAAAAATNGEWTMNAALLWEAHRLGATSGPPPEVMVTGRLAEARRLCVAATTDGDVEGLESVVVAFDDLGADLSAAEAAAAVAGALHRSGRARDAASWTARSAAHLAVCGAVWSPSLVVPEAPTSLTVRERETAELAARGMASKEIARALGVSVRTVSNHLQSVYVKLGISTRSELAAALDASL